MYMTDKKMVPVHVIDWYDGVVLATVDASWMDGTCIAALICWDQPGRLRVYALLPTSVAEADQLASNTREWVDLKQDIARMFENATDSIEIVCVNERTGLVVNETRVESTLVAPLVPSDAGETLSGERRAWLDLF